MEPIWKDYYYTIPGTEAHFRIIRGMSGDPIYEGRAVAAPGETSVRIRVNDICADYMRPQSPSWGNISSPSGLIATFTLQTLSGTTWTSRGSVEFLFDWSYDRGYLPDRDGLSFPIDGRIDPRQFLVFSVSADTPTVEATVTLRDGSTYTRLITAIRTSDFNDDFNHDYARENDDWQDAIVTLDLATLTGDVVAVMVLGHTYTVTAPCNRYSLYYVNAYGGWDSLLVSPIAVQSDTYARHTMAHWYDNGSVSARGTENYANEVSRTWRLHTGTLTDRQAGRMHHLLGSTCVYLQDLVTGEMMPVTISDSECVYKTFRNQGRQRVYYTFTAELAQDMTRR